MHSNLENSFTRSFYFSLLWWLNISPAQGFNYRAVEHLKQAWLELKTGEGVCLPGMLAGWLASWLGGYYPGCDVQNEAVPGPFRPRLHSREEQRRPDWGGALALGVSSCLPGSKEGWRFRGRPEHPSFCFSLSSETKQYRHAINSNSPSFAATEMANKNGIDNGSGGSFSGCDGQPISFILSNYLTFLTAEMTRSDR